MHRKGRYQLLDSRGVTLVIVLQDVSELVTTKDHWS